MENSYEIRRKLSDGVGLCLGECGDRENADQLAQLLNELWSGEYEIFEIATEGPLVSL